jgi:hypothetical protein
MLQWGKDSESALEREADFASDCNSMENAMNLLA